MELSALEAEPIFGANKSHQDMNANFVFMKSAFPFVASDFQGRCWQPVV